MYSYMYTHSINHQELPLLFSFFNQSLYKEYNTKLVGNLATNTLYTLYTHTHTKYRHTHTHTHTHTHSTDTHTHTHTHTHSTDIHTHSTDIHTYIYYIHTHTHTHTHTCCLTLQFWLVIKAALNLYNILAIPCCDNNCHIIMDTFSVVSVSCTIIIVPSHTNATNIMLPFTSCYLGIFNDCWISPKTWSNHKTMKSGKPFNHLLYCCLLVTAKIYTWLWCLLCSSGVYHQAV